MSNDIYWASQPSDEIALSICNKVYDFDMYLQSTGRMALVRRSLDMYYGFDADGKWSRSTAVTFGGQSGETVLLRGNHYRSLVDQRVIMVTGQRPSYEAMAVNNDSESAAAADLAEGIFEYQLNKCGLEDLLKEACKLSHLVGEGWNSVLWDPYGGDPYTVDPSTNTPVFAGDVQYATHPMWDVIRDITRIDHDHDWLVLRTYVNKWDLMKQYPEKSEEIRSSTSRPGQDNPMRSFMFRQQMDRNYDFVEMYQLFHKRTAAMPLGRFVRCVDKTVLFDGPIPYDDLPIYMLAEDVEPTSPFGHSMDWDLMGPQQAYDSALSTILTNHEASGIQNVLIPKGCQLDAEDLGGGQRALSYNAAAGKPERLELGSASEASYKLIGLIQELMETISGVSSVARGNPQASLKSGSALALVQSMSVQANSGAMSQYIRHLENVGTATIQRYQAFATAPHLVEMVGVDKKAAAVQFTNKQLNGVRRVTVSVGGPLMRSLAGRLEIASDLAAKFPNDINAQQYMQVMESGRLEPIFQAKISEPLYIHKENELLRQGINPRAIRSENHPMHIDEHRTLYFDLSIRGNEELMQVVLSHIMEHEMLMQNQMLEEQRLALPPGVLPGTPPPPSGPSQPAGGFNPAANEKPSPKANPAYQNTEGEANALPLMPMNPVTKTRTSPSGSNPGAM